MAVQLNEHAEVFIALVFEHEPDLQPFYFNTYLITMRSEEMRFFSILLKRFESRTYLMAAYQRKCISVFIYLWLEQFKKMKKTMDTCTRLCIWEAFRCRGIMLWSSDQNGRSSVFFKGKQPRQSTYADAQDKMHPPLLCHAGRAACNSTNVHNKNKTKKHYASLQQLWCSPSKINTLAEFILSASNVKLKSWMCFFSATINLLCKSSDRLHLSLCANNEYKWQFQPFDDSFQRCEGFSIHKREILNINARWHWSQRKTLYKDEVREGVYEQVCKKYIPVSDNTKQCFTKLPLLRFVLEFYWKPPWLRDMNRGSKKIS